MAVMTGAFFLVAVVAPLFIRFLGRTGFAVLALVPAAGLALSLSVAPLMLTGAEVWVESYRWLPALDMSLVFRMDMLSWIFSLLVTGVGALVFLYCARYFDADELRLGRFAGILMAFAGMMYGLIVADEMLLLFIFWEGTTIFSYLLIGQYHSRQQTRRAALQALIVTTAGGLAMLIGLILLGNIFGSGKLSSIVQRGFEPGYHAGLVIAAIILILVGAVSKSALVPFHFWLPGAMAAPTPVSAYLHAAAMVKAGIYLVMRLAPGFSGMPGWHLILLSLGIATMFIGAWQALKQHDLKLLLAYGTVSQLGFLTIVSAFGSRDLTTAALALLLAHSLFKAALFLIVGIIDHRAGTRDLRKLSGYARCSPLLFALALISAASMAGLPPTLGFAAKEAVFSTLLADGSKEGVIALIGVAVGSILTVAYSARFVWGAFAVKPNVEPVDPGGDSPLLMTAPTILTILTLTGGLAASAVDRIIAPWSSQLPAGDAEAYHLALWHGPEPALMFSLLIISIGIVMFLFREPVAAFQTAMPDGLDFHQGYRWTIGRLEAFAATVTSRTQRGSMPFYQGVIYLFAIATIVITLILNNTWPGEVTPADTAMQLPIAGALIIGAIAATTAEKRFAAVVVVGVTGYGMSAFFAHQGAPDLALTQALVETITIVVFVLVLRRLPARIGRSAGRLSPSLRMLIGAAFGVTMMIVAFVALGARTAASIGDMFPRLAYEIGHGKNVVNVTLVDIRAWDTLGELSVVVAAATGVASFIFVRSRAGTLQRIDANRPSVFSRLYRPVEDDLAPLWLASDEEKEGPAVRRNAWLLAGRTLSPANRSIMLEVIVRLIFHALIVFSVYLLFAGHNLPGGGFAAGLVAGIALALRYLAGGRYELAEAAPVDAGKLLGLGLALAAGTALGGLLWGATVFDAVWFDFTVPLLGDLHVGTALLFDIGVYLIVIGLMLDILRSLGAEVDRHQESDERRLAESLSTEETSPDTQQLHTLLGRMDDVDVDGTASGGRL
ncbi:Na+/H+ antiporter subunit A [Brevibacterium luteolum]|uniref:Na+/H+ antiporter subunit A n=1 Tax=Brevibacterium luteolum TaxID=199591 RepID=UPI003B6851BF